jgi:hypothetical protein
LNYVVYVYEYYTITVDLVYISVKLSQLGSYALTFFESVPTIVIRGKISRQHNNLQNVPVFLIQPTLSVKKPNESLENLVLGVYVNILCIKD